MAKEQVSGEVRLYPDGERQPLTEPPKNDKFRVTQLWWLRWLDEESKLQNRLRETYTQTEPYTWAEVDDELGEGSWVTSAVIEEMSWEPADLDGKNDLFYLMRDDLREMFGIEPDEDE